ncbi:MAG: EF-hand domain-containing protein [Gammaproteobacteria bacterium]|nr:EF-hand domain-containing protein [Gammaproteobacteria bacterium]
MKKLRSLTSVFAAFAIAWGFALNANESNEEAVVVDLETTAVAVDESENTKESIAASKALELGKAFGELATTLAGFALETSDSILDQAIEEQVDAQWSAKIVKYDADNDNALTLEEMQSIPPEESEEEEFKSLSLHEQQELVKSRFAEMDINADGKVTVEEVKELMQSARQEMKDAFDAVDLTPLGSDQKLVNGSATGESSNESDSEDLNAD